MVWWTRAVDARAWNATERRFHDACLRLAARHQRLVGADVVAYVIAAFECRVLSGIARPDGERAFEARYVTAAELGELELADWANFVLPRLMQERGEA